MKKILVRLATLVIALILAAGLVPLAFYLFSNLQLSLTLPGAIVLAAIIIAAAVVYQRKANKSP
jgi:hypothetical protein